MSITVRAYNVLFGDAILVSWDEADGVHHAWIDFGNFHNDANAVFEGVYADVLARTKGKLDLVVVTHRHLDHLEGFHALRKRFQKDFTIRRLWHAHVTPSTDDVFQVAGAAMRGLLPATCLAGDGAIGRIYRNNFGDLGLTTEDRMAAVVKDLALERPPIAIHRELALAGAKALPPGLKRLRIEILAPERDSSVYLRPLGHALALRGIHAAGARRGGGRLADPFAGIRGVPAERSPLLRLADLARLRRQLRHGGLDLLAAADTTRNNTSIVMRWTYGSTRLLFVGDAEETSWELMRRHRKELLDAHLVKVGHHGSMNASPSWCFDAVLPKRLATNAALVSTDPDRFTGENEVPKAEVLAGWRGRLTKKARLLRTDAVALGKSVAVVYAG